MKNKVISFLFIILFINSLNAQDYKFDGYNIHIIKDNVYVVKNGSYHSMIKKNYIDFLKYLKHSFENKILVHNTFIHNFVFTSNSRDVNDKVLDNIKPIIFIEKSEDNPYYKKGEFYICIPTFNYTAEVELNIKLGVMIFGCFFIYTEEKVNNILNTIKD